MDHRASEALIIPLFGVPHHLPSRTSEHVILVPSFNPIKQEVNSLTYVRKIKRVDVYANGSKYGYWIIATELDKKAPSFNLVNPNVVCFIVNLVPIAIVGALSSFRKCYSTIAQRVWTMAWLSSGIANGLIFANYSMDLAAEDKLTKVWFKKKDTKRILFNVIGVLLNAIPAIGGFVVVGQMLKTYGNCVKI
jgi:hypothetical protein